MAFTPLFAISNAPANMKIHRKRTTLKTLSLNNTAANIYYKV